MLIAEDECIIPRCAVTGEIVGAIGYQLRQLVRPKCGAGGALHDHATDRS
jgi:hypothetical protein